MRAVWVQVARGCARIDSRPDTAKIGSADRVEVHHARLLANIGVRKTFPHGLGHQRTCRPQNPTSVLLLEADIALWTSYFRNVPQAAVQGLWFSC